MCPMQLLIINYVLRIRPAIMGRLQDGQQSPSFVWQMGGHRVKLKPRRPKTFIMVIFGKLNITSVCCIDFKFIKFEYDVKHNSVFINVNDVTKCG